MSTNILVFFAQIRFLSHLHKTLVPFITPNFDSCFIQITVDNVYNLVHKSILSDFRAFFMWITFSSFLLVICRFYVMSCFFVHVAHARKVNGTFFLFAIF